jgi:hypothetical protein
MFCDHNPFLLCSPGVGFDMSSKVAKITITLITIINYNDDNDNDSVLLKLARLKLLEADTTYHIVPPVPVTIVISPDDIS